MLTSQTSVQGRKWCYTLNNPTDDELCEAFSLWGGEGSNVLYHVCGKELSSTGTPHLQGYIFFVGNVRLSTLSSQYFNKRAHFECALGTHLQNKTYCSKDGNFFEHGKFPEDARKGTGAREERRWDEARLAAIEGRIDDVDSNIYLPYYRTLKEIKKDHMTQSSDLDGCCGEWLWGSSGAGKSWKARRENPIFYYKLANKWWDGYQGEDVVIIEDLDPSHKVLGHHLKLWSDRYSFNAETKGGMTNIRPKKLVVTSQYQIREVFDDAYTVDALERRFKQIEVIKPDEDEIEEERENC